MKRRPGTSMEVELECSSKLKECPAGSWHRGSIAGDLGLQQTITEQTVGGEHDPQNTDDESPVILQDLKLDHVMTIIPSQQESLADPVAMQLLASVDEDQAAVSEAVVQQLCIVQHNDDASVSSNVQQRDEERNMEHINASNEPPSDENQSPNTAKRPQHENVDVQKSTKKHASCGMKFRDFEINWSKVSDNVLSRLNNLQEYKGKHPANPVPGSLRLDKNDMKSLIHNIVDQLRVFDVRIQADVMGMVSKQLLRKYPCLEFVDDDGIGNGMTFAVIKQKLVERNSYLNRFKETSDHKLPVPNKGRNVRAGTLKSYWQKSSKDCVKEVLSKLRRDEPELLTDDFLAESQAFVRFQFNEAKDLNQLFAEFPVLRRRNVLSFHFEKATGVNIADLRKYYSLKRSKIIEYSNTTSRKFPHLAKDCSDMDVFKFLACIVGENLNDLVLTKEVGTRIDDIKMDSSGPLLVSVDMGQENHIYYVYADQARLSEGTMDIVCAIEDLMAVHFVHNFKYLKQVSKLLELLQEYFMKIIPSQGSKSTAYRLEREVIENEIHFIKIHAPLEVLRRYSEILKLRMPMKESLCVVKSSDKLSRLASAAQFITHKIPGMAGVRSRTTSILSRLKGFAGKLARRILVEEKYFPPRSHRFTAVYSRDKEYLFDLKQACFFTAAIRSRIVQFILDRKRFLNDSNNDYAFGIERLITDEVYIAAYPLHDGEITVPGSMRHLLYTRWAAVSKWYRYQPLDYIKEYFGVKIGLYFAWLGYYTYMLLLASIVGVICFVYSWKTLKYNTPSEEICSKENIIKMCPLCDHWCDYWELSETCLHARVTYLFDNPTTVLFAIFMSFWAALFLELWKRYSAEITHRWDLTGFDIHEEHPRPQYLARLAHVRRKKINAVTNTEEPQVPYWRMKLPATILSFSVVLLLVCLAIVAVLAVVLYRMSVLATLSVYGDEVTTSTAILFTTATAATINLCLIVVFNWMYTYLAEWLTERELLRTQTEFDDSLTLKIYLLQFVNYYASIFYIAFFKGKFIGYPGNYNRFFNFRQEECGFGGCLMELCIQLGIIMIGKQAVNTALEMAIPLFYRWLNSLKVRIGKERNQSLKSKGQRFVKDLKLVEWGSRGLFPEYLEMVLQYGFVTIFVAAFPLAPLFALLNNILEMRLDAKKLLTFYRRPVSQRVRDIGIWYRILDSIGKLSVITNGFIIAFTSDFIPKFVYRLSVSSDGSLNGYLNYTLAYFNTSDFQKGSAPFQSQYNVTICRYPDFRAPPWSNTPYEKTTMYWLIMAARLAFVVIFENIVAIVMILVRWCIPDMSQELRDQIRREAYITNEIIIKQETLRARMDREADTAPDELSAPRFRKPKESGNDSFIQLERLISSNLSGSQLDLFIHSEREDQRKTRNDKVSPKFL